MAKPALARRGIESYFDNILYLDANQTSVYAALSYQQSTYAAKIDNKWYVLTFGWLRALFQHSPGMVSFSSMEETLQRRQQSTLEAARSKVRTA